LLFAARTLAVSRDNPRVLHGEVKISRATVKRIVKNTTLFGWSNAWLSGYTDRLLRSETEPPV
jgi:farnesyl-diphosphate farnesyltransferase